MKITDTPPTESSPSVESVRLSAEVVTLGPAGEETATLLGVRGMTSDGPTVAAMLRRLADRLDPPRAKVNLHGHHSGTCR